MAKITYASLKLKTDNSVSNFEYNGNTIEVLNYLPIESKYDLIMITLQKAEEDGIYNPLKVDMYFHLNLIYLYTNITFTEKQREDESKLYDSLVSNGLMDKFLETISAEEYNNLVEFLNSTVLEIKTKKSSISGILNTIITDLPKNAQKAAEIISNFDPEQYQKAMGFVEAINGGRPIGELIPIK